jgi:hypothetical protein
MPNAADEFRQKANDCLLRAENSPYEVSKASRLKVAEKWQRLAERLELRTFKSQAGKETDPAPSGARRRYFKPATAEILRGTWSMAVSQYKPNSTT